MPLLTALLLAKEPITNLANPTQRQECGATEYLEERTSPIYHRSPPVVSKKPTKMIPPHYFAAQLQAAQRRVREGIQAVPTLESDGTVTQPDNYFNDCVLDLSRYLTSSDLPATPREFFDDLFHEKIANDNALQKPLPGVIKVKEEPDSTATSRCSTPESLLPEHDFDNGEFPTPKFQQGNNNEVNINNKEKNGSLMCQLQSIQQNSNQTTDADSNDSDAEMDMENLDINAQKLKAALAQLEQTSRDSATTNANSAISSGDKTIIAASNNNGETPSPAHKNALKSPRLKTRKAIEKGTDEYIVKRERNNVAVRKSRTKAKLKHIETQMRVGELTEENEQLRNRVASLQKELNALKSFISYNCPSNVKPPCFSSYPQLFSSTKIM